MSTSNWVYQFEQSAVGQWFITLDPNFVIVFQLIHVFGFLSLLTAAVVLLLRSFGQLHLGEDDARLSQGFFRVALLGLVATVLSGLGLFLTSVSHYFSNRAMPVKLTLLALAIIVQFAIFRRVLLSSNHAHKGLAIVTVLLWFATGFAGRAIGFV